MSILQECPLCKRRQRLSNKVCKCGERLDRAKRSARLRYWITYRLPNGMQRKEYVGTSIDDARAADGKRKGQKREGRVFDMLPDSKATFAELEKWYFKDCLPGLPENKRPRPATLDRMRSAFKSFNGVFGNVAAGDILPQDIERYRAARMRDGVGAATLDVEINIIRGMVSRAFDNEKVGERTLRAFRRVGSLTRRGDNARKQNVSIEDYLRLLEAAPKHFRGVLVVAMNTGMRPGELRQLAWPHIDRKAGFIRLPAELTKEKRAKAIPINHHVRAALEGQIRHINHDLVFTFGGKPIAGLGGSKGALRGSCRRAGIAYGRKTPGGLTMHDLRRTVKTNMLAAGVDKTYRDLILGHALEGMDRHYINPTETELTAAMDRYTAWLDGQLANVAKMLPSRKIQNFK